MSKKGQKESKKSNNLLNYFGKIPANEDKNPPQVINKNEGKKKTMASLNDILATIDKPNIPINSSKKLPLILVLKSIAIQQIVKNCPHLVSIINSIEQKSKLKNQLVAKLIRKNLISSNVSLWCIKYAPRQINELFNIKSGEKIKQWLNAFFQYKNKIREESDSFLNDFQNENSCKTFKNIMENHWHLLALVVKGRPGIGKSAAIRAVVQQMQIQIQECGNDYNQTKYLKEKNQSTQSESVKTAITKKGKIEKNSQMITKFLSPIEKEKASEVKRGQLVHNIGLIYPQSQAQRFYNQLAKCIELSKIPFIMTLSSENSPKQCQKFDIIEFQQGSLEKIERVMWSIYQMQKILNFDRKIEIQKDKVFQVLNQITQNLQYKQYCSMQWISNVCSFFNYRLDYIYTYLQQQGQPSNMKIQLLVKQKYKEYSKDRLMSEIKYVVKEDWKQKYLENSYKVEDPSTQDSVESDGGKQNFQMYLQKLKIRRIEDLIKNKDEKINFVKGGAIWIEDELDDTLSMNISIQIHRQIKRNICKNLNKQINLAIQKNVSRIKVAELAYAPMLIKQKRNNRTNKSLPEDSIKKIMDKSQFLYLKNFCDFIKTQ